MNRKEHSYSSMEKGKGNHTTEKIQSDHSLEKKKERSFYGEKNINQSIEKVLNHNSKQKLKRILQL